MAEARSLAPLEALLLVRLLTAGDRGARAAELRKDLEPLLGHRWSGAALTAMLERGVIKLVASEFAETRPGKTKRAMPSTVLTPQGTRAALELLKVAQLPAKPRPTWASLKKGLLLAPALGLSGPGSALSKDDSLRAVLLREYYGLPLPENPTLKQAREEWLRKTLGMGEREKVTLETVHGALLRREAGEGRPLAPKKAIDRLLAKRLGARRDDTSELREALLRGWIDRGLVGASPSPPAGALAGPAEAPDGAAPNLADFSRKVLAAARTCATGQYGGNKVFIAHVWRSLQDDPEFRGVGLEAFKRRLAEANNARQLDLSRADLIQAMDPGDVRQSEVSYLNATFHFIRLDTPERQGSS